MAVCRFIKREEFYQKREGVSVTDYIKGYQAYLVGERHASANTLSSYTRDVRQFETYLESVSKDILQVHR